MYQHVLDELPPADKSPEDLAFEKELLRIEMIRRVVREEFKQETDKLRDQVAVLRNKLAAVKDTIEARCKKIDGKLATLRQYLLDGDD